MLCENVNRSIDNLIQYKSSAGNSGADQAFIYLNIETSSMNTIEDITFWFTGLPSSGKTSLADKLKKSLELTQKVRIVHIDGIDLQSGLTQDLGSSEKDLKEGTRRAAYLAQLLNNNHIGVVVSVVTPTEQMREMVRSIVHNICMIYLKCSLEKCREKDTKGTYYRQSTGPQFETPSKFEIVVDTENQELEGSFNELLQCVRAWINE